MGHTNFVHTRDKIELTHKLIRIHPRKAKILKIDSKIEVNVQNLYTKESRKILKNNSQLRRPALQLTEEKAAGFYFIPEFLLCPWEWQNLLKSATERITITCCRLGEESGILRKSLNIYRISQRSTKGIAIEEMGSYYNHWRRLHCGQKQGKMSEHVQNLPEIAQYLPDVLT